MTVFNPQGKSVQRVFLIAGLVLAASPALGGYQLNTLAEGLNHPWCMAFLPDGDLLVTERDGALRIIRDGVLAPQPIAGVPEVYARGQGGLFDVVLHPEFASNRLLYLTYAHGTRQENATRIARARFTGEALEDLQVIFTVVPLKDTPHHFGGRLLFLPDDTLLLTTGDGYVYREAAQQLDSLLGKVVRLTDTGAPPPDNPFAGTPDARPEIWTLGHRNPQGLVMDDEGRVYLHEHGPRGGDELNLIEPGKNYGWPVATFGIDYNGAVISPFTEYEGMTQPLLQWTPSIAPAGMAWHPGGVFPEWRGSLFVTSLVFNHVQRITIEDGQAGEPQRMFEEIDERIRDVRAAPDGRLYILTDSDNGRIIRVDPTEARPTSLQHAAPGA